tara:strand:- start:107 stop:616 length:510 start_codon:yes stop_codon:yes gene_type:complete
MTNNSSVVLGRITAVHGIKGWVIIRSFTTHPTDIFTYDLFIKNNKKNIDIIIEEFKVLTKKIIAKIQSVNHIEQAIPFVGKDLLTYKQNLFKESDSEYFWYELVSCDVYNKENKKLGVVKFLERIGDNDVMIISSDNQKQDILIPFMKAYILDVNLNDKLIKVDWDENF